ncbi:hypothetical protein V6N13_104975 [Hibiscus sabdariffa]|uniref:Leucine-rich repeat-containing N-terminal plant-type domain-containing protein n=1 Tax=Hibiscus sabdariffa TaxID=183260 RepID=A0ABR2SIZ4_9ROSI
MAMGIAFLNLFLFLLIFLRHSVSVSGNTDSPYHHHHHSLVQDKAALLAFKKSVLVDPKSMLADWEDDVHVCNFTGVLCNHQHHRVIQIDLSSSGLVAKMSPFLSNLTALRRLNLYENQFFGTIPPEISSLRHLQILALYSNNFTGPLSPSIFSNCSELRVIDLSLNYIRGRIPVEIGNCPGLWALNLYYNELTGQLPAHLINTTMYVLDVGYNHLSGELPSDLVSKLPDLIYLYLPYNNMRSHGNNTDLGPFFATLGNFTGLMELDLSGMGLGGRLPGSIGHPNLTMLEMQDNHIFGPMPPEIGNLSNIIMLSLRSNFLNGEIPASLGDLIALQYLFLNNNLLSGDNTAGTIQMPETLHA